MKLVVESLNELYSFEKRSNPLVSIRVGQTSLIENWLNKYNIKNYIINDDYTINTRFVVYLSGAGLVKLPDYIQFNKIEGSFNISNNELITMKGFPKIIEGFLDLEWNQLSNLEGCPLEVRSYFNIARNKVQFEKEEIREICDVKGGIFV
jgi:hypothetical protein